MDFREKIVLMDEFLNKIGDQLSSVPKVLDNNTLPKEGNKIIYRLVEDELIRNGLVLAMIEPGTNKTAGGWGMFRISPRGLEFVNSNKSVATLFPKELRIYKMFELLQEIPNKSRISIQMLANNTNEDVYKVRKLIDSLSRLDFVKAVDFATKDVPDDIRINLTDKGEYAKKSIDNFKEELREFEGQISQPANLTSEPVVVMNKDVQRETFKNLISKDRLKEFFVKIKTLYLDNSISSQLILLEARLENVKKEDRKGTMAQEAINIEKAKIRNGLLELVEEIVTSNRNKSMQLKHTSLNHLLDNIDFRNYIMSITEIQQELKHIHGKLSWRTFESNKKKYQDEIKEYEDREKKLLEKQKLIFSKIKDEFGENVFRLLDKII